MHNFGKYWVAGLTFAIITGAINIITSLIGEYQPDTRLTWKWDSCHHTLRNNPMDIWKTG